LGWEVAAEAEGGRSAGGTGEAIGEQAGRSNTAMDAQRARSLKDEIILG